MTEKKSVIFLMGPTASGKTKLATQLHKILPVDIISVDSALVYRGMDIGTAKPTLDEQRITPHRLIDIRDPAEPYSAADFRHDALREIEEIINLGRIPLLVGGTMLYFKALLDGLSPLPPADQGIRKQIEQIASTQGWQIIHKKLCEVDPVAAQRIHPNDPQRLSRAYEVYLITGKSMTELTRERSDSLPYKVHQFAIAPNNRALLHKRIEERFHIMLTDGFEGEVKALFARKDLHESLPSIRCVGYRQMWAYISGNIDYDKMVYQGVCATRQLAKRQMTWLRGWPDVTWLDSDNMDMSLKSIAQVISLSA